jgi:predicted nucleic acid-binding protein
VIVLDTTVLVYAIGAEHPLRDPCRRLVDAIGAGHVEATTTVEVIQELVHVRARRRSRADAARQGRSCAALLAPLIRPTSEDLADGLALFEAHDGLGAFDAVLAASALARGADALVSADEAFAVVPGLVTLGPMSVDQVL